MPSGPGRTHSPPPTLRLVLPHLLLDMGDLLPVLVRGAAQGEHDLTSGVEPEIVQARDWEEEHHKDEPIVDNDML